MTSEELCRIAQSAANRFDKKKTGLRVVVVVTDESGDWVGVGSNTTGEDVHNLLQCALEGDDLVDHTIEMKQE